MSGFRTARYSGVLPDIGVRSYTRRDRDQVFGLLSFLPRLYPRSFDWLERKLIDVDNQRAFCNLALVRSSIAGILLETPKGVRSSKISTFFVSHHACGRGLGSLLFQNSCARWQANGIDNVYVTVAASRRQHLLPFLHIKNFVETQNLPDRYGPGRDEYVYGLKLN